MLVLPILPASDKPLISPKPHFVGLHATSHVFGNYYSSESKYFLLVFVDNMLATAGSRWLDRKTSSSEINLPNVKICCSHNSTITQAEQKIITNQ